MTVLEFKRAEKTEPHGTGPAFCIGCRHEWSAIAPAGTVELECPQCECMKGRFRNLFETYEDEKVWVCNCGNDLFKVTETGTMCVNCGEYQRWGSE